MPSFSKISQKNRDFTLVVNVDQTAFGFKKGDKLLFKEYEHGDKIYDGDLVAVSRFGQDEVEIGQKLYWKSPNGKKQYTKIRLWNNQVGGLLPGFRHCRNPEKPSVKVLERKSPCGDDHPTNVLPPGRECVQFPDPAL